MSDQIRVNTEQVSGIAQRIHTLNLELDTTLQTGQTTIKNLATTWQGKASEETITSFNSFASKYFQEYQTMIDNYVKFLQNKVQMGYSTTEQANISLADTFK